jgi:hypothetical protein
MKRIFYVLIALILFVACTDDDNFSMSNGLRLSFTTDTVCMDTVFSKTPSSTYAFWVHNDNNEGIRLSSVHLNRRNQTGFRVNVDGSYLDNTLGSQINNLEFRRNDSILVFVELTSSETSQKDPTLIEDDLVFTLESGVQQKVNLRAWSWDAVKYDQLIVTRDSVIESASPIIIYKGLKIQEGVTLTIRHTTLYFHDQAGIDVYGNLVTDSCMMRGDRLDRMFDYLPYDRVSGQWKGIHFYESSAQNSLSHTEIRNAEDAIVLDSAKLDTMQVRLSMTRCVVHNAKGNGLEAVNAHISLHDCQFSNTWGDCVSIIGGIADVSYCTLAQFYPFNADRGAALRFTNYRGDTDIPLLRLHCEGSIVTGYDEDVVMGAVRDTITAFEYQFVKTLLRTPKVETADSIRFSGILWETPKDSIQGKKHFKTIDEDNLYYDFHLDSLSTAQGMGCYR